ncbi:uncharacterized protein BDR25DRAFT_343395 [Lindgomyces ingoldianus]|uniref:Uncharacterized protein n=1 Tax=Lindgomyces ingoldianus TaxID=673940 RepID=A0ACB6QVT0_9PLEO|nr:uncharacterized protein BDR25DRAFT_343395 [Lindgomyces ingoldianus]KAF2470195.1 hypothetical protein BDR25DRAFT_343395 [Lindgomyces ingoldianus]
MVNALLKSPGMLAFLTFMTFWSLAASHVIPSLALPSDLHSRQAPKLKAGAWLMTYKPSGSSQTYKGSLRVTSDSSSLHISGDWYNSTAQPNPADGIPILPRSNYYAFIRATKLTSGNNRAFTMGLEAFRFKGFHEINNYTVWDDSSAPLDGGYITDLSPTTAPTGYPDSRNYFEGDMKIIGSGSVAGRFTMGWVNEYVRKITLEIGSVSGMEVPNKDISGQRTWKNIFSEVGWDIKIVLGKTDIPEPTNTNLPAGMWKSEQQHAAMLQYRKETDFDKEWKYYLLLVKRLEGVERGAMFDPGYEYNSIPREGTAVANEWIVGTIWDGTNDTGRNWGTATGKKFVTVHDAWFRTCVHEVGHFFNLQHPPEFVQGVMTDTQTYVDAGRDGLTAQKFPENVGSESLKFTDSDKFLMMHRPDLFLRPGFVKFGAAAQNSEPPEAAPLR